MFQFVQIASEVATGDTVTQTIKLFHDPYKAASLSVVHKKFEDHGVRHQESKVEKARQHELYIARGKAPRGQQAYCSYRKAKTRQRKYRPTDPYHPCRCDEPHSRYSAQEWESSPGELPWDYDLDDGGYPIRAPKVTFVEPVVTKTRKVKKWWETEYGLSDRYPRGPWHKSVDPSTEADDERESQDIEQSLRLAHLNASQDLTDSRKKEGLCDDKCDTKAAYACAESKSKATRKEAIAAAKPKNAVQDYERGQRPKYGTASLQANDLQYKWNIDAAEDCDAGSKRSNCVQHLMQDSRAGSTSSGKLGGDSVTFRDAHEDSASENDRKESTPADSGADRAWELVAAGDVIAHSLDSNNRNAGAAKTRRLQSISSNDSVRKRKQQGQRKEQSTSVKVTKPQKRAATPSTRLSKIYGRAMAQDADKCRSILSQQVEVGKPALAHDQDEHSSVVGPSPGQLSTGGAGDVCSPSMHTCSLQGTCDRSQLIPNPSGSRGHSKARAKSALPTPESSTPPGHGIGPRRQENGYSGRLRWSPYRACGPHRNRNRQVQEPDAFGEFDIRLRHAFEYGVFLEAEQELEINDEVASAALKQEREIEANAESELGIKDPEEDLPIDDDIVDAALKQELALQADNAREVPTRVKFSLHHDANAADLKQRWDAFYNAQASRVAQMLSPENALIPEVPDTKDYKHSHVSVSDMEGDRAMPDPPEDFEMSDVDDDHSYRAAALRPVCPTCNTDVRTLGWIRHVAESSCPEFVLSNDPHASLPRIQRSVTYHSADSL